MGHRSNLQGRTASQQLRFDFGGRIFPLRADNEDCPFSAPHTPGGVFNGVLDHRGEQETKLVRLGLTYRDAVAMQGPPYAYAE